MPVTWFPTETNAPNDPKIKAICRKGGQAWAGATWLMWCFVGTHGRSEPGLGTRADGTPLPLQDLADECLFDSSADAKTYLDFAAERGHIHPQLWQDKGIVFVPAMWTRLVHYARTKGRQGSNYQTADDLAQAVLHGTQNTQPVPSGSQRVPAGPGGSTKTRKAPTNKQTNRQTDKHKKDGGAAEGAAQGDLLPKAAADHPIKDLLTYHDQLFTKATGQRFPNYTDGDCKNVKLMLRKTSLDDLKAELAFMFECTDPFIRKCGYSIGAFMSQRSKLTVLKTQAGQKDSTRGRTATEPGKYAELG